MPGESEDGGGRFDFGDWSDDEFRDRFMAIIGEGGKKNNTYKFAWARFLLDHSCDPCMMPRMYGRLGDGPAAGTTDTAGGIKVTYAEVARYFFAYYWPLACRARLRQGPAAQRPGVMGAIEGEFTEAEYRQSVCRIICEEPERVRRCLKKIARVAPKQVVVRFQKVGGREDPMFYHFAAGPADKEGNRRIDPRGGILVNRAAARFLQENYEALSRAVTLEWLRATDSFNPGAKDLVGRFGADYDGCATVRRFLPGLEAKGRLCFYCGARPGPGERMCVDHFLPAEYVGGAEPRNLVLACQRCGREKACMLPPSEYVDKLARRNAGGRRGGPAGGLAGGAPRRWREVRQHYETAKSRGYCVAVALSGVRP